DLARFVLSPFGHLAVLAVETRQGTLHALCTGYPHAWLAALATELSRRCRVPAVGAPAPGTDSPAQPPAAAPPPLPPLAAALHQLGEGLRARYEQLQAASAHVPESQEEPDQPPSSRVTCQVRDDGVTLLVPPGRLGLFFLLGCGLCVFAALPTLAGL